LKLVLFCVIVLKKDTICYMKNIISSVFAGAVCFASIGASLVGIDQFNESSELVEGFIDNISDASDVFVDGVSELDLGDEAMNNTISKISNITVPNQDNPLDSLFTETFRNTAEEMGTVPSVVGTKDIQSVIPDSMPELSSEYKALLSPEELKSYESLNPEKLVKLSVDSNPVQKEFINSELDKLYESYGHKFGSTPQKIAQGAAIGGAIGAPTGLLFGAFNEGKVSTPAKAQAV
jgi:hypothetical protein